MMKPEDLDGGRFEALARAIAALPDFAPGAAFSGRVLAALGLEGAASRAPRWENWVLGAFGALISCTAAGVVLLAVSSVSVSAAVRLLALLADPANLWTLIQARLDAPLLGPDSVWPMAVELGRAWAPSAGVLSLQAAAAAIITGVFMTLVSRMAPAGATAETWRSL